MLAGRNILIGISGSIAAYKIPLLVRLLVKQDANVRVVMTKMAKEFVTPVTLATVSQNPVHSELVDSPETGEWTNHVDLALWADYFIIAPVSANTLAKMATAQSDNLLLTTFLSAKCPVFFAPAMDLDMYANPATQTNIEQLKNNGYHLLPAGTGQLASGLEGEGRMAEPEQIVKLVENYIKNNCPLSGKTVLITSGPTYEPIDPVRFIGNRSSGKMGNAIAEEAIRLGADVQLVSGPVAKYPSINGIHLHKVETAEEMHNAATEMSGKADIIIMAAAVADYKPEQPTEEKIKKKDDHMSISLVKTKDILRSVGKSKLEHQTLVGFALETENGIANAKEKLAKKNLDLIVLNSPKDKDSAFGYDTNKVTIITADNKLTSYELMAKSEVAKEIFKCVLAV